MTLAFQRHAIAELPLIAAYFQRSAGQWRSERRYYTLPAGKTMEIVSDITVTFLEQGCPELQQLADLHNLSDRDLMICGTQVTWDSRDAESGKPKSDGTTIFGAHGNVLYRDRGYALQKPVTATFSFTNTDTLCLFTEYSGSTFEEELKLIGQHYRTRQTIISRAGEQQMIGQYLETRV